MKQLLFCYKKDRKLFVRNTIITDVFVPVEDIISPQKSTLTIPKTNNVQLSDIVVIRDNASGIVEYIGYIDTIETKTKTEISCYPLINVFDNDYVLDQMFKKSTNKDGTEVDISVDAVSWLITQLERAFIKTDDDLQALPFIIRNKTKTPVLHKQIIETANLFDVYVDLFIEKGLYVVFNELQYNMNEITGIYCDIYCNKDENPYILRHNDPFIINSIIVDNTFTNTNKIIATEELEEGSTKEPKRYYFYLLNNNEITTEPDDTFRKNEEKSKGLKEGSLGRRIKQVRSKEITFGIEVDATDEENAKALLLKVYNELQAPEYNLQITIDLVKKDEIKLHKRVDFFAESGIIYTSNVTKIEKLNDLQIRLTLGALRNSLTDFKKKVEAI